MRFGGVRAFSMGNVAADVWKRSASAQGPQAVRQEKPGVDNTKLFCYPQWYFVFLSLSDALRKGSVLINIASQLVQTGRKINKMN